MARLCWGRKKNITIAALGILAAITSALSLKGKIIECVYSYRFKTGDVYIKRSVIAALLTHRSSKGVILSIIRLNEILKLMNGPSGNATLSLLSTYQPDIDLFLATSAEFIAKSIISEMKDSENAITVEIFLKQIAQIWEKDKAVPKEMAEITDLIREVQFHKFCRPPRSFKLYR